MGGIVVTALGISTKLLLSWVPVSTGIDDHLQAGKPLRLQPPTQANSSSYPMWHRKWVLVKVRWCSAAEEWRQDGSFQVCINVWMAGKTVWSLVNTCQPERFRDECPMQYVALIQMSSLFYFTSFSGNLAQHGAAPEKKVGESCSIKLNDLICLCAT